MCVFSLLQTNVPENTSLDSTIITHLSTTGHAHVKHTVQPSEVGRQRWCVFPFSHSSQYV